MAQKICLFLFLLLGELWGAEQLLLVVTDSMETPYGSLQRYERRGKTFVRRGEGVTVNVGRNGLGIGLGLPFEHAPGEPVKREGDGRAPAGIFPLRQVFGYAPQAPTKMPYRQATADLICIDDSSAAGYNTLRRIDASTAVKSFEWMKRDDELYALGVTVGHNGKALPERGSCIFLHIQKGPHQPTSGCTSMSKKALEEIVAWLDPAKSPLLVQIPRSQCEYIEARFDGVSCP